MDPVPNYFPGIYRLLTRASTDDEGSMIFLERNIKRLFFNLEGVLDDSIVTPKMKILEDDLVLSRSDLGLMVLRTGVCIIRIINALMDKGY
uniref:Uncharacterized protein n=1 Tax=Pithovirus LCDPAC01 TaxID=2506600 RepID=A0A481YPC9_9VIRU|nr:MAG: hypothetical protein LCDPAC01_01430 [Pithovirus LCDPAC01]